MRMRRRLTSDLPRSRMPLGVNIAVLLGVAVVTSMGTGALLWWLLGRPPIRHVSGWTTANSFEFAKIVLALIGGVGAVVALVIAYRKQHLGEAAEKREDIKLFAERFTKAADHLGSDKAPVRLAGMYALEDLAQGTSTQRQTIVNVLCAYLRMPYLPPVPRSATSTADEGAEPTTPSKTGTEVPVAAGPMSPVDQDENERRHQERQVRLTTQRILATHLRPGDTPEHPADTFWKDIDLDLTGATLLDLDFSWCHIRTAQFGAAEFGGIARFSGAKFYGIATFVRAKFGGDARFNTAEFGGHAAFDRAKFGGNTVFDRAKFGADARFGRAEFDAYASFGRAMFGGETRFDRAKFSRPASFDSAMFGGDALFRGAKFDVNASFSEVRVRLDVSILVERVWPDGLAVVELPSENEARLPDRGGKWGYLETASESPPGGQQT